MKTWPPPFELPPEEEFDRPQAWLISFVDLISLLLSFMILVFAAARLESNEWRDLAQGIRTTFGGPDWMTPDRSLPPTQEPGIGLPTLDLGYLAVVVEARLGSGPTALRVRLDGNRLRITPPPLDANPSPLRQLGAILGHVGNALTIDVRVPSGATGAPLPTTEWEIALNGGIDVAAALIEGGVAPNQIAVFATSETHTAPEATTDGIDIVVLDHGARS